MINKQLNYYDTLNTLVQIASEFNLYFGVPSGYLDWGRTEELLTEEEYFSMCYFYNISVTPKQQKKG